jgi:predicted dehydrogenase
MTDRMLKWGIVGLGQIAYERFLPGLLRVENAQCVAFADTDSSRRDLFQKQLPEAIGYESLEDLLASKTIDVLYVSLPTGIHRAAVELAAKAGVHILCEKPLASTLSDAEAMVRATKLGNVRLMTAYMSRFGDVYTEALRIVREGLLGQIVYASAHFSYDARGAYPLSSAGAWRWTDPVGGGPMLDIGIYLLFALRELLGSPICPIASDRVNVLQPSFTQHDTHTALFRSESGVPGTLVAAFSHNEVHITIYGTEGKLTLANNFSQRATGTLEATTKLGPISIDASSKGDPDNEHYFREARHYTDAILADHPHTPSADDVLSDMRTIQTLLT